MSYILLFFAAANITPAYLGTYKTEEKCRDAIRVIYETRLTSPSIQYTKEQLSAIKRIVDTQMSIQHEYKCIVGEPITR